MLLLLSKMRKVRRKLIENKILHKESLLIKNKNKKGSVSMKKEDKKIDNKEKEKTEINEENPDDRIKNIKENVLKDIKKKIVKIKLTELKKEEYEGKCFCFLILNNNYIKKFFEE